MSEYAMFYNSVEGDRVYDADDMTDWLKPFFVTGVFNGQMQVTANDDMTVTVANGYVNIGGKVKKFPNAQTFDIETASGTLNRIDNVIVRRNDTDRDITVMIQKGGYAEHPTAPEIVRSGACYDLKIAEIYIAAGSIKITQADITDTRADSSVCGWVVSTVQEIDFSQITAQFNAYFARYQGMIQSQYATYLSVIENLEGQGQQAYTNMLNDFSGYEATQRQLFSDLYEEMRDLIGEATAAMLQNEIDEIKNTTGVMARNLATKLAFTNGTGETLEDFVLIVTNTDTGTVTRYTFNETSPLLLTEHGDYTVEAEDDGYVVLPHTFTLDHTKTTETIDFDIYSDAGYAYVGGYVGAYVASGTN